MATSKTAVAKSDGKGTAVATWKDKLKGYAKQAVAVADEAGSGGQFISVKAGQLTYNGATVAGNKLKVVVLEGILENCFYLEEYDPDSPASPVCFAFGREVDEMVPHEKSLQPQHETCKGCPMNEFGTADKGKGKACKNVMRLAMIPGEPLNVEAIRKTSAAYFKLPVTSVKNYTTYAKKLAALHELPPFAFVTELTTQPDAKTQFKVLFDDVDKVDDDLMDDLIARHEEQVEAIAFPYQAVEEAPKPAKGKKPVAKARKY